VKRFIVAVTLTAIAGSIAAHAQSAGDSAIPIVLLDSTGKIAARAVNDTMMLINAHRDVVAPAFIRPVYDGEGRAVSGIATWTADGSVLFTSADCTSGGHVFSSPHAGVRATNQVETPNGIVLYVGAVGSARTASIRSILYASGCASVTVRQNGLIPVDMTVNLTTSYPPPLSLQ